MINLYDNIYKHFKYQFIEHSMVFNILHLASANIILVEIKTISPINYYMMVTKCFESGCMNEAGYACKCSSPEILLYREHIGKHANLPNKAHNLELIFIQPYEGTKEAILEFLTKENSK